MANDAGYGPVPDGSSYKVETLESLARALLREVESVERELPEVGSGVDFAGAVRRFETGLIRRALEQTGGHQRRAASLLGIKVTTLNAKIIRYGIRPKAG